MASLKKINRSSVWQAQYYVSVLDKETGKPKLKQVRKSTGETNKKKARIVADAMELAAQGAMPEDQEKVARLKTIHSLVGHELANSTLTGVSLRKHFSAMMQILNNEELKIITIDEWCNEWLERKERDTCKATMARYKGHVKALKEWLGEGASKPLQTLTTGDVERWKRHLLDKGITGKTVASYLKDVGQIYRTAIKEGLVSSSPVAACQAPDMSDSQQRKPFTVEEIAKIIDAAPTEQWSGLIVAATFTGLRLGDVARLKWSSVDLETKKIELMPAKTKRKKKMVSIPIQDDLLTYFSSATITDDSPDAYVFPDLAKLTIGSRAGLSQTFQNIMAKAGIDRGKPSKEKAEGSGRVTWERGFHSLRHTFTTWLRIAGVSEEDRMALTGHSTRDSHSIYSHSDEQILRKAVAKLPTLKGGAAS
jgi:integrase